MWCRKAARRGGAQAGHIRGATWHALDAGAGAAGRRRKGQHAARDAPSGERPSTPSMQGRPLQSTHYVLHYYYTTLLFPMRHHQGARDARPQTQRDGCDTAQLALPNRAHTNAPVGWGKRQRRGGRVQGRGREQDRFDGDHGQRLATGTAPVRYGTLDRLRSRTA